MKAHSLVIAALVLPVLSLAGAIPSAEAVSAVRWASDTGSGIDCLESNPCSLDTAVEAAAVQPGDEVVVKPGSYTVAELDVTKAITLHGQAGQPVPTITTSSSIGLYVAAAAHVHDLTFVASAQSSGIYVAAGGATIERVRATVPFAGATACVMVASVIFRDSVCRATGTNSKGLGSNVSTGPGAVNITLRNVTATGGYYGVGFDVSGADAVFGIDAKNVIAHTDDDLNGAAVRASAADGASVLIALANSNYETRQQIANGGGVAASVTEPGTGTNQVAAPIFVDAPNGDFHQAAGSPTLDAGVQDASTGAQDIDGEPRAQRSTGGCPEVVDIGADERGTPSECDTPETSISSGPTGASADTTPTFGLLSDEPGSSFECRTDANAFASCTTPHTTAVLAPGAHTFEARATDPFGNVDPTPASRSFSVTAPPAPPVTTQATAPNTTLTKRPKKKLVTTRQRLKVSVEFTATSSATFQCSLDGATFAACTSPYKVKVGKGKHVLLVRAVGPSGLVDATPVSVTFTVKKVKSQH